MAGGRQIEFNKQQVLDKAMRVFWKKGFMGASLTDLTQSMGINKPSMYATFGNKEDLFVQATENYLVNYAMKHGKYLNDDNLSLKDRLKDYLMSVLSSQCNEDTPKGCYISLCISESAGDDLPAKAQDKVDNIKNLTEKILIEFFGREQSLGHISIDLKPNEIAQFIVTVMHGLAAMVRGGKTKKELEIVIDVSLHNLF